VLDGLRETFNNFASVKASASYPLIAATTAMPTISMHRG
jgi:hypothetical protein